MDRYIICLAFMVIAGGIGSSLAAYPSAFGQYNSAAVTSHNILCSDIGVDALNDGGSAVDAAIATALCISVVDCHLAGIGGGNFMTIYDTPAGSADKQIDTVIAREMAPGAAHRDMYINQTELAWKGGLSIATPGEISGFQSAHSRYGRLAWSRLFSPSIDLARNGFELGPALAGAMRQYEDDIMADENLREIFVDENGELKQEGDMMYNEKLAVTMERIADDPDTYYLGSLAADIAADIAEYDGIVTEEDLNLYRSVMKDPLEVTLTNGYYIAFSPRPPSSGAVVEFIINILDGYHFGPNDLNTVEESVLTYHRIAEAFKFAYARRSDLGDEDFLDIEELLINMTSSVHGDGVRGLINDTYTQDTDYYNPSYDVQETQGTSHISVAAPDGAMVAITSTVNFYFGSNCRGRRTGIIFNDEMDDFSTPGTVNEYGVPSSPANYIEPYKRPMSSMGPTLVVNQEGEVMYATGGAGGTRITTATSQVLMNSLWFKERIDEATESDRLHHQLLPDEIKYEPEFNTVILQGLRGKGHEVVNYGGGIASVQSLHNTCYEDSEDGCLHAAGDGRSNAEPAGF